MRGKPRGAFTIVELLTVLAIIALLIAMLMPSLQAAREAARRAVCASNLSHIATASITYAAENAGMLFICRLREVPKAFNPRTGSGGDGSVDWIDAMATVGLASEEKTDVGGGYRHRTAAPVWNCPSRNFQSQWETTFPQLVVGYQYYGGIDEWRNPFSPSPLPSRSPHRVSTASGSWALASDSCMKIDYAWGGGRKTAYGDMPSHKTADGTPAGANHVFMDGAVQWVDFADMIYIHTWNTGGSRVVYWYQHDLGGWTPPAAAFGTR